MNGGELLQGFYVPEFRHRPFPSSERWCQANANQSPKSAATPSLCRQLTPLGQRGGAVLLEVGAAFKMSVGIEMVEGRSMNGGEFL